MSAAAAPTVPTAPLRRPRRRGDWPQHLVICAALAIELLPIYMMLQVSMKDNATFLQNPWLPVAPADWQWGNWSNAFRLVLPYLANTVVVATLVTLGSLTSAVLGAYFFARQRLPLSGLLWSLFMALMLLPSVVNLIPLFMLLRSFSLLNTLWGLVLVGMAAGQVFNLYVLRNFIAEIPRDLFEAAEIDGAGHLRQVLTIVLPTASPIIGTLAVLTFLASWNDFLLPLIVLRDKQLFTLGVGLVYLDAEYVKQWGRIMAAYCVASIPLVVLFLFTMRLFVRGLSAGAIKG